MKEIAEKSVYKIKHVQTDYKRTLDRLVKNKKNFKLYVGSESAEIIVDGVRTFYTKKNPSFPPRHLAIFKMVRSDANKYIEEHGEVEIDTKYKSEFYNLDYDEERGIIVGFDINHAYWRVAYNLGIISQKTYERGMFDDAKASRLAALSTLGRAKPYHSYQDGEKQEEIYFTPHDNALRNIYRLIRQTTYMTMSDAAELLADEFDAYKVDCIYFRDSLQNRELMDAFFEDRGLEYKILEH